MVPEKLAGHPSKWRIHVLQAEEVATFLEDEKVEQETRMEKVREGQPVEQNSPYANEIFNRLSWEYEYPDAATHRSKQSVSELKRNHEIRDAESGTELVRSFSKPIMNRPRFMQEKQLTPAEKGTAMHMVMQHVDLSKPVTEASLREQLDEMVDSELLYPEQREAIEIQWILAFFDTDIGKRLVLSEKVSREVPFYLSLSAKQVYPNWDGPEEPIFVQGVIDCVFEDAQGTVLLDFKTDGITTRFKGGFEQAKPILEERYRLQLSLYARALEEIWKRPIEERYLYFFDGGHLLKVEEKEM